MRIPFADTILTIEIGNTRAGIALADERGLHDVIRVPHDESAALEDALRSTWAKAGGSRRAALIASVAPERTPPIVDLIERACGIAALRLREDVPLPLPLEVERPDEVGADRVCSAAAAYDRIQGPCAVASFGTAITIDCVSAAGAFLGGAILPGLDMSCLALHEHTALLPRVSPGRPQSPFGRSTREAIVAGVAFGAVGALREVVERFATELGQWPHLVITGGNAPLIAELADFVDSVVPDLCLMGIALAYRKASA
ncbi:MAG: type III pantothenate kinase [Phycisphaerae bacterium]